MTHRMSKIVREIINSILILQKAEIKHLSVFLRCIAIISTLCKQTPEKETIFLQQIGDVQT